MVAVIILIIVYVQMFKNAKKSREEKAELFEIDKKYNKLLYESQVEMNSKIKSGEIKIFADKDCGCKDKKDKKKTVTKKKENAKV